jgi:hypothetical protein
VVGVGQDGQRWLWRKDAAHDAAGEGVEDGQNETWERVQPREGQRVAPVAV